MDFEDSLINSIESSFPNVRIVGCLFHYSQNLMKNLSKLKLMKSKYKKISLFILKRLALVPFIILSNDKIIDIIFKEIKEREIANIKFLNLFYNFKNYYFCLSLLIRRIIIN